MNEPYKRLEEAGGRSNMQNVRQILTSATSQTKPRPKLKLYHGLVLLAFVEVCVALLMVLLGISCTAVGNQDDDSAPSCRFGTAVWVGILCLVAGTLGLSAFRVPQGRKGYMVAYMVFCVLTAVADGLLIIFSSVWIIHHQIPYQYSVWRVSESKRIAALCFNSLLLIIGFLHMMLSIISSAFVCYNWNCCGGNSPEIVIVYAPNSGGNDPSTNPADTIKFLPPNIVPGENTRIIYA